MDDTFEKLKKNPLYRKITADLSEREIAHIEKIAKQFSEDLASAFGVAMSATQSKRSGSTE